MNDNSFDKNSGQQHSVELIKEIDSMNLEENHELELEEAVKFKSKEDNEHDQKQLFLNQVLGIPVDTTEPEGVKVMRTNVPVSELNADDELLVGAFTYMFMLGKAYSHATGGLSFEERNHLLKQFTLVPGKDRCLLGYLADAMRRLAVIKATKVKIAPSKKAVENINSFMDSPDFFDLIEKAKLEPNGKESKIV